MTLNKMCKQLLTLLLIVFLLPLNAEATTTTEYKTDTLTCYLERLYYEFELDNSTDNKIEFVNYKYTGEANYKILIEMADTNSKFTDLKTGKYRSGQIPATFHCALYKPSNNGWIIDRDGISYTIDITFVDSANKHIQGTMTAQFGTKGKSGHFIGFSMSSGIFDFTVGGNNSATIEKNNTTGNSDTTDSSTFKMVTCPACNGKGVCQNCNGTGIEQNSLSDKQKKSDSLSDELKKLDEQISTEIDNSKIILQKYDNTAGGKQLISLSTLGKTASEMNSANDNKKDANSNQICSVCSGTKVCPTCNGTGTIAEKTEQSFNTNKDSSISLENTVPNKSDTTVTSKSSVHCTYCNDHGDCPTCGGLGGCDNCTGDGIIDCDRCYNGICSECAGYGTIDQYTINGVKTRKCTYCNNGSCKSCKGYGYKDCPKCDHGECPKCKDTYICPYCKGKWSN